MIITDIITETEREKRWIQQTLLNNINPSNLYQQAMYERDTNLNYRYSSLYNLFYKD